MGAPQVEIVIRGTLSEALDDIIDGFHIDRVHAGETHLIGPMPDQSGLHSILSVLGSLNIQLVSVNPVDGLDGKSSGSGDVRR